jgi:hypothetical protein
LPSKMGWLWSIHHIPRTCRPPIFSFPVSVIRKLFWKDNDLREVRKSLRKWREHWQRHRKMVSRNASKGFMNVGKSVTAQGNYSEGNIMYTDVGLLISVYETNSGNFSKLIIHTYVHTRTMYAVCD